MCDCDCKTGEKGVQKNNGGLALQLQCCLQQIMMWLFQQDTQNNLTELTRVLGRTKSHNIYRTIMSVKSRFGGRGQN